MPPVTKAPNIGFHCFRSMDTDVTVVVPRDDERGRSAIEALFAEWDGRLSRFQPEADLARLNAAAGAPHRVGDLLFGVIDAAIQAAIATDGLFDPLLGRRMEELGYDRTFDALLPDEIGLPLRAWHPAEWRNIAVDRAGQTVTLLAAGGLDLGGIAKGMAVDAALFLLVVATSHTLPSMQAAISPSTVSRLMPKAGRSPSMAVFRARSPCAPARSATSSVERRRWRVDGRPRHHLLDPRILDARRHWPAIRQCRSGNLSAGRSGGQGGPAAWSDGRDLISCYGAI